MPTMKAHVAVCVSGTGPTCSVHAYENAQHGLLTIVARKAGLKTWRGLDPDPAGVRM